ncbi:hypothetical protein BSA16_21570 [Micromonospora sp. Rc5]|nr:hypothetical protein BSA16_21570 [Micromonospora sp. Rc5]
MKVTADLVVLTIREHTLQVALVERAKAPFAGMLALPGGFVRPGEDLETTARRELREETGLDSGTFPLRQLKTYSAPERDPRGRVITTVFLAIAPNLPQTQTPSEVKNNDVRRATWVTIDDRLMRQLAFDHRQILEDARHAARNLLEHTPIATDFCGPQFTITELRTVYEIIWGTPLDARNFHRKALHTSGFIEPTGQNQTSGGRPARLYRVGPAKRIHPPLVPPCVDEKHSNDGPGQAAS